MTHDRIPVLKPKLPQSSAIIPYLEQIDANRWYGNYGPLVRALEARIADMLHAQPNQVIMIANGTLGLTVALQALEVKRGSLCIMPSWTFTATPAAALAAGLEPIFLDVDKATQALTPEYIKSQIKSIKQPIGAVIPVSSFGAPLNVAQWDRFTEETGIPVVIDAAAAFDTMTSGHMHIGRTPVMISLHATKICGIGEGGLLLSQSSDTADRIRHIINFGFENDRLSHRIAINGKGSEYNAAVGMAVLDNWAETRAQWGKVQKYYIDTLGKAGIECWMHPDWITSTCNIIVPNEAAALGVALKDYNIDTRRWWETGCHVHPAYRSCRIHDELTATKWLGQSMLGLPGAIDISEEDLRYICNAVIDSMHGMHAAPARASA